MQFLVIGYGQIVVLAILVFFLVPLLFLIRAIIRWLNRHWFEPRPFETGVFCLFCLLKLHSCVPIGAQLARFAVHFVHKLTGFASIYIRAAVKNGRVMVSGAEDIADARSRPRNRAGRLGAQFSRSKVPSFEAHRLQKGISLVNICQMWKRPPWRGSISVFAVK